ncbi:MAG: PTS sugar transporter subunit IIA [Clostridium sp.]|uniref:PTS sugar transporter subunit IIA n=1 Tax=Clostridium sp. TaxID=1506 RepID=UPI002913EF6C|nr:PTS sugar transporter subunit IIA [Clostridium sp.]MDU4937677.1 PTS sugar transporter subunit IIA [Clostridium sp.]
MYQIVIASHGPVANAMKESLQFFFNDLENVHTVTIDKDGISKFSDKVNSILKKYKSEEVLVFVDIFYGTPFNEFARQCTELVENFEIIAGANMPSLMEAVNYQNQNKKLVDVIDLIINAGKVDSFSNTVNLLSKKDDE